MDWMRILELSVPVTIVVVGSMIKNAFTKGSSNEKLENLEAEQKEYREEHKEIKKTLTNTNQTLASLNATVQGLSGWLKRVDERQFYGKDNPSKGYEGNWEK